MLTIDRDLSLHWLATSNISRYFGQPGPMPTPMGCNKTLLSSKRRFDKGGGYEVLIFNLLETNGKLIPWLYWEYLCLFCIKEEIIFFLVSISVSVIIYASTFAGLLCTSVLPSDWHWNSRWRIAVSSLQAQFELKGRFSFFLKEVTPWQDKLIRSERSSKQEAVGSLYSCAS